MQQELPNTRARTHGGVRKNAGRKPSARPIVLHRRRPYHDRHQPVHATLRTRRDLPSLRDDRVARGIGNAIRKHTQTSRTRLRVVHFSIQPTHIHLLVEAHDKVRLARGLQGVTSRVARAINGQLGRRGPVFAERYHGRALAKPKETRNAIVYVLLNYKHHVEGARGVDPCSSGFWWNGWRAPPGTPATPCPVAEPKTWLLRSGWMRHGRISWTEAPAGTAADPSS